MRSINRVILIGNATREPELRTTKTGKPVANLRIATNRTVGGKESTQYHTVICWDTLAETTSTFVKKGEPLCVEGRLEYRTFQDAEGKERSVAEIIAQNVLFLGRKAEETAVEDAEEVPEDLAA